jgi:putative FmdB family regulatory protein
MPLYEYQCKKCAHRFERIQKFSDKPVRKCPQCGGVVEQLISAPAVQFKGTGWYVTDYARKSSRGGQDGKLPADSAGRGEESKASGDSSGAGEKSAKSDKDKGEAKPKTESKGKVEHKNPSKK